jgi:hypothetical protein
VRESDHGTTQCPGVKITFYIHYMHDECGVSKNRRKRGGNPADYSQSK